MCMDINKNLMTINHTALKRSKNNINYIVCHYVGALGDAKANTDYYKSTYVGASADFWVGFKGDVWQGNDYYNYYSWHCGGGLQGYGGATFYQKCLNKNSIGIEMCVRKRSTKTMNATDKDWYFEDATIESTAQLVAHLMKELDIDIDHVIRHYDVTGKICPNPFVYDTGKVTWKKFKEKILGYYNGATIPSIEENVMYYRVGTAWENGKCVNKLGAYTIKDNAISSCPYGYKVFDDKGNVVYTAPTVSGTQAYEFANLTEAQSAAKILEMAKADYIKTGVLASVTAAQMILESGYVKTELAKQGNNCFGMKCTLSGNTWPNSTWDGKSKVNIRTAEEYTVGNITYINADFRSYPCIEDSIGDHSAYLLGAMNGNKKRYEGLKGCTDYKKAISLIKSGGYATDSRYEAKICSIIERFGLDKYDKIKTDFVEPEIPVATSPAVDNFYRTGTSWKNGKCVNQTGAYTELDNAKKEADNKAKSKKKTYYVFDSTGKKVYTAKYTKPSTFEPYNVRVKVPDLRIRKTPNGEILMNNGVEVFTGIGVFGITEEKKSGGYIWGKLLSSIGWIALVDEYVEKV